MASEQGFLATWGTRSWMRILHVKGIEVNSNFTYFHELLSFLVRSEHAVVHDFRILPE